MDTALLKSDIFFVVTTIAIIIVTLLVIVGLGYILNILNIIRGISKKAEEGAQTVISGIHEAKEAWQEEGYIINNILDIFRRLSKSKKGRTKNK